MDDDIYNGDLPYISNLEWGLVTGFLFVVDFFELLIIWIGVGLFLNTFIDFALGPSYAFYLKWRGIKLTKPSRLSGMIGAFVLEAIPGINALPLWGLDGIVNFMIYRAEVAAAKLEHSAKNKASNVLQFRQRPGRSYSQNDIEIDKAA
jgi:hypothetical protein